MKQKNNKGQISLHCGPNISYGKVMHQDNTFIAIDATLFHVFVLIFRVWVKSVWFFKVCGKIDEFCSTFRRGGKFECANIKR